MPLLLVASACRFELRTQLVALCHQALYHDILDTQELTQGGVCSLCGVLLAAIADLPTSRYIVCTRLCHQIDGAVLRRWTWDAATVSWQINHNVLQGAGCNAECDKRYCISFAVMGSTTCLEGTPH